MHTKFHEVGTVVEEILRLTSEILKIVVLVLLVTGIKKFRR
jgi:hypothetical protein